MKKSLVFHMPAFRALKAILLLTLCLPLAFAFANMPASETSCAEPSPTISSQTSSSVDFSWSAVLNATGYNVKYTRSEDSYTSGVRFVTGTSTSFSGLPPGTYQFHFQTVCIIGTSDWIITEDLIME